MEKSENQPLLLNVPQRRQRPESYDENVRKIEREGEIIRKEKRERERKRSRTLNPQKKEREREEEEEEEEGGWFEGIYNAVHSKERRRRTRGEEEERRRRKSRESVRFFWDERERERREREERERGGREGSRGEGGIYGESPEQRSSVGSFVSPIGSSFDCVASIVSPSVRSFRRISAVPQPSPKDEGPGKSGDQDEGQDEDEVLLTEEEILYELYGKRGWRYNRFFITFLASLPIFIGILATTLYLPAFTVIRDALKTTDVLISASVSVTTVASGTTPLIYGPISDRFGRRVLLLVCLPFVVLGSLMTGLAPNVYVLIGGRFVMGLGMGADAVSGLGAMTDVWPSEKRSTGITLTLLPSVIAPIIASPLGGFLTDKYSWRWCCLLPGMLGSLLYIVMVPLFPETLPSKMKPSSDTTIQFVETTTQNTQQNKSSRKISNPFIHMGNPKIAIPCISSAFIMSTLTLTATLQNPILSSAFPSITPSQLGYAGLPIGIGTLIGAILGGFLADRGMRWKGDGGRLLPAYVVGVLSSFVVFTYSFFIEQSLVGGLTLSGVIGMLVPASRPGMYAFAIGQDPQSSSAITGLLHVIQFAVTAPLTTTGPIILKKTNVHILFLIPAVLIIISIIPLGVLVGRSMGIYDQYEDYEDDEDDEDDEGDDDDYDGFDIETSSGHLIQNTTGDSSSLFSLSSPPPPSPSHSSSINYSEGISPGARVALRRSQNQDQAPFFFQEGENEKKEEQGL